MNTLKLRGGRAGEIRPCHPWIYKGQILKTHSAPSAGSIVSVLDSNGKFIGRGYYNSRSEISVRLLTFRDEKIDRSFFSARLKAAIAKRSGVREKSDAYRAVFSEADSLPGLIVDVYRDTVVFQILTLGMEKMKDMLAGCIREELQPKYLYEKSVSSYRRIEGLKDFSGWAGEPGSAVVEIREGPAKFFVDIANSHKTGFYLDQRASRTAIGQFTRKGCRVLDLFCYTGAFSVCAALGGADEVVGIDIKEDWLELARRNAELNNVADRMSFIRADAFNKLKDIYNSGEKFGVVIIDPPSFLKNKESVKSAAKGYEELNYLGMSVLNDGGVLATFSCSHNMPNEIFSDTLKKAAAKAGKETMILKRCHQAEDHPIDRAIPETEYLKGYFLRVRAK